MEQEFEDYLKSKKIDPLAFKANEPDTFREFERIFLHMHPNSFTMQKLFFINLLRRKYHFATTGPSGKEVSAPRPKPVLAKPVAQKEGAPEASRKAKPVVKPKMTKPVIGAKKTDNDEALKQTPEKRPVIRPKLKKSEESKTAENNEKAASKPAKPVIRPVIKPKPGIEKTDNIKEENKKEEDTGTKKPMKKPVVKPRIPKPKKEE